MPYLPNTVQPDPYPLPPSPAPPSAPAPAGRRGVAERQPRAARQARLQGRPRKAPAASGGRDRGRQPLRRRAQEGHQYAGGAVRMRVRTQACLAASGFAQCRPPRAHERPGPCLRKHVQTCTLRSRLPVAPLVCTLRSRLPVARLVCTLRSRLPVAPLGLQQEVLPKRGHRRAARQQRQGQRDGRAHGRRAVPPADRAQGQDAGEEGGARKAVVGALATRVTQSHNHTVSRVAGVGAGLSFCKTRARLRHHGGSQHQGTYAPAKCGLHANAPTGSISVGVSDASVCAAVWV
eukprot:352478-Chlamydomonas_euryale.AAC.7